MQAIKLNTAVNLTSGLSIPSGSVVVIAEGYADVKSQKDMHLIQVAEECRYIARMLGLNLL